MTSVEIRKSKSERLWSIAGPLLGVVALAFTSSAYVGLLALAVVAAGVAIFSGNLNQFVRDTYAALYDEASNSRAELMELAIIFLILVEILLALVRV